MVICANPAVAPHLFRHLFGGVHSFRELSWLAVSRWAKSCLVKVRSVELVPFATFPLCPNELT
jgi:hypothetical protein